MKHSSSTFKTIGNEKNVRLFRVRGRKGARHIYEERQMCIQVVVVAIKLFEIFERRNPVTNKHDVERRKCRVFLSN